MKTTGWIVLLLIALTACGGSGTTKSSNPAAAPAGAAGKKSAFTATPVQLNVDPCTLVTAAEAREVMGLALTQGRNGIVCTYVANGAGGTLAVTTQEPTFCKLLFLALDKNFFGGKQVRVNDLGDGGMLVKGNGHVEFVSHGGCVSISAQKGMDHPTDETMLRLGRTAATRVV
ncbi:MAG: DUF3558 family protein [Mycobacteriales bacterium]